MNAGAITLIAVIVLPVVGAALVWIAVDQILDQLRRQRPQVQPSRAVVVRPLGRAAKWKRLPVPRPDRGVTGWWDLKWWITLMLGILLFALGPLYAIVLNAALSK